MHKKSYVEKFKDTTINHVERVSTRKARIRAMKVLFALHIFAVLQTIDDAQSRIMHTFIDSSERLAQALQKQSAEIESTSKDLGGKIATNTEDYKIIIQKYQRYLDEATQYLNESAIAKSLNRRYDKRPNQLLREADSIAPSLENTQLIVEEMSSFLDKIHTKANILHKVTANSHDLAIHAHATLDVIFFVLNVYSILYITYQSRFVAGEYWRAQRARNISVQRQLEKSMGIGGIIGLFSLIAYFGYFHPYIQDLVKSIIAHMENMTTTFEFLQDNEGID